MSSSSIQSNDITCPTRAACSLNQVIEDLVEEFEDFDDWEDRYQLLIEMGKELPKMATQQMTEENQVQGCLSTVWMVALVSPDDPPILTFSADSDAAIVKGLVSILLKIYSGRTPEEVLACDIHCVFERLELDKHLSRNRRNGLGAMIQRIQNLARLCG